MNDFDRFINSFKAVGEFVSLCSPIVIAYFIYRQHKTDKKIDGYHKEVNGNMQKLIETTEELAERKGKEQEQKEQKAREKKRIK